MFFTSIISKILYISIIGAGSVVEANFNKYTKTPQDINEKILFNILKRNKSSKVGIRYKFQDIDSIEMFKQSFPLTDYSFYENYIDEMAKGKENILFTNKLEYFSHTSGTTGKQKLIPTTAKSRLTASKYMAFLINKFAYSEFKDKWNYGRGLALTDILVTTYTEGNIPICSATSGGMKSIKPFLPYMYTSPIDVMEIKDKETSLYLHLLFALLEDKLLFISGVFISNVLDLFRVLEKNYDLLLKDIKKGTINRKINLDENTRKKLNKMLRPNASRHSYLEAEFKKGFNNIANRIWPNLAYIATVAGANFEIYDKKLQYYIGDVVVYSPVYSASEGTIGINPYVRKIEYVIIPDTVYYEFIPKEHINEKYPKTLNLNEIKLNECYEVVITNFAGLYRYRLGDVVKVVGFYNECPSIEFMYRKNQLLNMVAEKTNEDHLTTAIKNTVDRLKLNLVDYTTSPDNTVTPGRYVFFFEIKNIDIKCSKIESVLDEELKKSNLAYARARDNKKLDKVKVVLLKENTFARIKESLMKKGISKNQLKIPRVVTNNTVIKDILKENYKG